MTTTEQAEQDYAAAVCAVCDRGKRLVEAKIAIKGMPTEQESNEIMKALEDAQKALDNAVQARDDAG